MFKRVDTSIPKLLILLLMVFVSCASSKQGPQNDTIRHGGGASETLGGSLDIGTSTGVANSGGGATTATNPIAPQVTTDSIHFSGSLPTFGDRDVTLTVDGQSARTVHVHVPSSPKPNQPLLIVLHGTGDSGAGVLQNYLVVGPSADRNGYIVVAPTALPRAGTLADVDHYENIQYPTGWNIVEQNPETNEDLLLLRAVIQSARNVHSIDVRRIYLMGFSNGAFFSYFAAMRLNATVAAFVELSGGAIPCENRGSSSFRGISTTCTALAQEPDYPSCTGTLKPTALPAGRIPAGLLAHGNQDYTVSVAWSCMLAAAMGSKGTTLIFAGSGHEVPTGFVDEAWTFLSTKTLE